MRRVMHNASLLEQGRVRGCDAAQQLLSAPGIRRFVERVSAVLALAECTRDSGESGSRASHHPVHGSQCHSNDRDRLRNPISITSEQSRRDALCTTGAWNAAVHLPVDGKPARANDGWSLPVQFTIVTASAGLFAEAR